MTFQAFTEGTGGAGVQTQVRQARVLMASVPETLGEAVPVKGLLLGFSVQKGRASTPQAQPPGDPGLKPDHASLWVRRWLRAAISLPGRLLWHRADLTAIVCNQTSALGPGSQPGPACLGCAGRPGHVSGTSLLPSSLLQLYRWSCSPILQTGKLRRAERKALPGRPSPLFFCVRAISFSISEIFSRIPMVADEPGAPTHRAAEPGIPPSRRRQNCVRPEAHGEQRPRAPGAPGFRVRTDDVERSA